MEVNSIKNTLTKLVHNTALTTTKFNNNSITEGQYRELLQSYIESAFNVLKRKVN